MSTLNRVGNNHVEDDTQKRKRKNFSILEIQGLTKRFGPTISLNKVDLDIKSGEIHALLGQNGAGKSTLIKCLAGVYEPDAGEISLNHEHVSDVHQLPISFIHQDLGLVDSMTVAENVAITSGYTKKRGLISWMGVSQHASRIVGKLGVKMNPNSLVSSLSASEKSIVGIARALAIEASVLVLDEPTATLPIDDVDKLLSILTELKKRGVGILYVTHRLDEVFKVADRVTILRDGKNVGTHNIGELTADELVVKIVGRKPKDIKKEFLVKADEIALSVRGFRSAIGTPVSFEVPKGQILGMVGLRGAGHSDLARAIFGLNIHSEDLQINGKSVRIRNVNDAIQNGVGFISSKRVEEELAAGMTVRENLFLNPSNVHTKKRINLIRPNNEKIRAQKLIRDFVIHPSNSAESPIGQLSGGNQQKVVIARWLIRSTEILVIEEPTIGVDIGAKFEIYDIMLRYARAGKTIILVSSDFEEVAKICQRALVFLQGELVSELHESEITVERITLEATGAGRAKN